ncbi:MAG TPA: hypothetical protein VFN75_03685 [Pseudonocardiaceae bacterium]|nr:hypothetical protein [Pseudonocardiaceae bacterium]
MSAEFRSLLSETLSRQIQLNKVLAEAEQAGRQVYTPTGSIRTPASTRVGAGILAAIEIVRIGLECATQYKAGAAAMKAEDAASARQGVATMNWWMRLGLTPVIALAKHGSWETKKFDIVFDADQALARKAATSETPPVGVPDFDMVVVTGLDGGELRKLVHRAVVELATLEDWHRFNSSCPAGPASKQFDDGWGVRLWSREDKTYGYINVDDLQPGLGAELDRLDVELGKAQQGKIEADVAAAGAGNVKSVKDTAWIFGSDRRVYVYNQRGGPKRIDFDSDRPRFLHLGTTQYPFRVDGPQELVKAADMPTYRRLAREWWARLTGTSSADESGTHEDVVVEPNSEGLAYVQPNHLIKAPAKS